MLTLPTFTLPSYSLATSSRIGAIILQGPHHSAQKSTSTGVDDGAAAAGGAAAAVGAAAAAGAAAAGAGILIVGAAVGFGGKLMRTVSFLGCTFAASAGFGGTTPGAGFGIISAISFFRG